MRVFIAITLIGFSFLSLSGQAATESQTVPKEKIKVWSTAIGLRLSYNVINTLNGEAKDANRQNLMHGLLTWEFDISDYMTIGLMGGYGLTSMKEQVDFASLPLSLRIDQEQYAGLLFGIALKSDFASFGDFTSRIQGEFFYWLKGKKEWPIDLPVVSGKAEVSQNGFLASADLLLQYDGLIAIMPFAGIRGNVASGQFTAQESIEDLTGEEKLKWTQKTIFGPVAGATFELGSSVEITLTASLLSRFGADLQIRYLF